MSSQSYRDLERYLILVFVYLLRRRARGRRHDFPADQRARVGPGGSGREHRAGQGRGRVGRLQARRDRQAGGRHRPHGPPRRAARRDPAPAARAPAHLLSGHGSPGDPRARERGDRGVHARRAGLVLPPRSQHEPARRRLAGMEHLAGAGRPAGHFGRQSLDREHGVQERRDLREQRPRSRSVRQPKTARAPRGGQHDPVSPQDGREDARRRRGDQPSRRVRPRRGRRAHLVRGRRLAAHPQRPPVRDAQRHRGGAAPREPSEGSLPPERQPRAAHAAHRHRRLDRPARRRRERRRRDAAPRTPAGSPVGPGPAGADRRPARSRAARPRARWRWSCGPSPWRT